MNGMTTFIEQKMTPIMSKIGGNKILTIIRDSMSSIMALLIIGSVAVLLANFPYEPIALFLEPAAPLFNGISMVTTGMMGLITAGTFAFYASHIYKGNTLTNIMTSIVVFLLTQMTADGGLNIDGLGSMGLLTAMIVAYVTVRIDAIMLQKNIGVKMPASVPPAIANSFQSLLPATISFIIFGLLTFVFHVDINNFVGMILQPIVNIINTPWGYAIYHILCALVFFCGINSAVVIGIVMPIMLQNGAANDAAIAAGQAPRFFATVSTDTLIWAGGTGATIGLVLLMTFAAKSKYFKTIGKMAITPSVFNINEPIIFGTPIVFNPVFFFPFILVPGIIAFTTAILMTSGVISMPVVSNIPWTIPPIIAGFVMTAGNIPATIWALLLIVVSLIIYYPFFRAADNEQYQLEKNEQNKMTEVNRDE